MCRRLILLLIVFGVIAGLSSVASALPLIGEVVRSGGNSGNRAPIGAFTGNTPPLPTQAGGWTDGNYCFSDREYTWINTPDDIDGAEYIRTFNTDKGSTVTYTVTFPIGATVLLTADDRFTSTPQSYVDNIVRDFAAPGEFTDTGWDVFVGGDSDRQLSVFSAAVLPGTYVFHDQASSSNNFYVIGALDPPVPMRKAHTPDPEDGSRTPPDGDAGDGHYILMQFTAGYGATTHTAYFSEVEQEVIDRNPAVNLGSPPYPTQYPTGYYVGLDVSEIPEFARTPLDRGVTYYWVVDESNDTSTYPGDVWSFTIASEAAYGPTPADGEELVLTDTTLSWNLGDLVTSGYSVRYMLYIGTDEAAVEAIATGNTTAPEYMGTIEPTSFDITDLDSETEIFWRVDTRRQQSLPPFPTIHTKGDVWSFTTAPAGVGGILREWWSGISGTAIPNLTDDPNYPDNPSGSEVITSFQGPTNWADNYGSRIHGWLYVTQTGDYTFWIATDDNGELWLSTDSNPSNAVLVSQVTAWASAGNFDDPDVVPSSPIHLEAGEYYYIAGLMKEGGGGDNIAAAWECLDNGLQREIIPGNHLKPYVSVAASNPNPANNSVDIAAIVTLSWTAGTDESTDSPYTTQHVYVGNDPIAVANATTLSPEYMGNPTGPNEYGPLSPGYYEQVYWRVDGENADTGTVVYVGYVWTFKTLINPAWASNPDPADGATDVDEHTTLSWTPGVGATGHYVYLGADDPANMVLVSGPQPSSNYTPPALALDTTYYWRIVEAPGMGEGLTWSFTTSNYLVVDDMESYTPWTTPGNNIFEIWLDGFGDCAGSGNGTGAVLTENADPIFGGVQSMKYDFDNDGTVYSPCDSAQVGGRLKYSKAELQIDDLASGIGTNWTIQGVKALSLRFYGNPLNIVEPMWVQLRDSTKGYGAKVTYGDYADEDPIAITEESWHEWFIDMADFDVDPANLVSITIGFGNENGTGVNGNGTVYFDDFRLYTPKCFPSRHTPELAKLDFAPLGAPDCRVDYQELDVMADDWLLTDALETGELLVRWQFDETAGTIAADSSGNGRNGDVNDVNGVSWVNDAERGRCLDFAGGDYVLDNDANTYLNGLHGLTISVWVKNRETIAIDQGFIIFEDPAGNDDRDMRYDAAGATGGGVSVIKCGVTTTSAVGQPIQQIESSEGSQTTAWQHLALTWSTGEELKLYIDGVLDTPSNNRPGTYGVTTGVTKLIVGKGGKDNAVDLGWNGLIDDVQIYNHALSAAEIATVKAGGAIAPKSVHYPVPSSADVHEEAPGSGVINFKDYSELMDSWLVEVKYPQ